jgi:hypothetical protein
LAGVILMLMCVCVCVCEWKRERYEVSEIWRKKKRERGEVR